MPDWRVPLVPDEAWLRTPLPPTDPGRYRRWHEKWKIAVGQTHLSKTELNGNERYLLVMSDMEATIRIYGRADRQLIGNFHVPGFGEGSFDRGDVLFWPHAAEAPVFVVGNSEGLGTFSGMTGERISVLDERPIWEMGWSPDRRYLICSVSDIGTQTSVITFFEVLTNGMLSEVRTVRPPERIDGWALSGDNRFLAITYYPSDTLVLIDLPTGSLLWQINAPTYSNSVDISPDGTKVAVGGERLVVMAIDDPARYSVYEKLGNNIHQVRFSPSGDAIAATAYDGHARILSTASSRPT